MVQAGMDVARLNFSHGDHATHRQAAADVRAAAEAAGRPVALLGWDVATKLFDEPAQPIGLSVPRTRVEDQQPAIELDDPLPQGSRVGRRGFGLNGQ